MKISSLIIEHINTFEEDDQIVFDGKEGITKTGFLQLVELIRESVEDSNAVVGILVERSALYIGLYLTLLERGITIVPLNTEWSDEFKSYILTTSGCTHTIQINKELQAERNADLGYSKIKIKSCGERRYRWAKEISYIIFTSGSTGKPKGVCISKDALEEYAEAFNFGTDDSSGGYHLITGEITFDIIIADLIIALKSRKALYITRNKANIFEAAKLLLNPRITSGYFVPSLLQEVCTLLSKRSKKTRTKELILYSGGEKLTVFLCRQLLDTFPAITLFNMYGPTESTVNCLGCKISQEDIKINQIPTGDMFENMNYYFDNLETPCSPGSSGELLLSGPQLMEGYVGSDAPGKGIMHDHTGYKYYATGDIFYMGENKRFYFKGRRDSEIKLKGNRINISALEEYCMKESMGEVIMFIVKDDLLYCFIYKSNCSNERLREVILKQFPSFCIPYKIIDLRVLPRNKNGKLDKLQLASLAK